MTTTEKTEPKDPRLQECDAIMDKLLGPGWQKRTMSAADARRRVQAALAVVEERTLRIISDLSPAEQEVLNQRLYLRAECAPPPMLPLSDAARERVREIEEKALRKLRRSVPEVKR